MKNKHLGTSFESFLKENDLFEETQAIAIKRVLAYALSQEMKKQQLTKIEFARRMSTSRASLDRLLDPKNTSLSLKTLMRAAHILGKKLMVTMA